MPALEPLPGSAWSRTRRPSTRAPLARPTDVTVLRLAPDDALAHRRRRASTSTTRTRSSSRRPGSPAPDVDRSTVVAHHVEWSIPPSARRSPRARSPASRPSSGWSGRRPGVLLITAAAYADELAERLGCLDERVHRHAAADPLADEPKPATTS